VDDYLDQFRDLIYNSGYTDLKTVMVKFRRGLDRRVSTALAGMMYGRPSDMDPEAWFRLAVGPKPRGRRGFPRLSPTALPFDSVHEPPSGDIPTRPGCTSPAVRPLKPVPGQSCPDGHRCGTKGQSHSRHLPMLRKNRTLGEECDLHFDVRYMDTDELERELENKFAAKDVASAEPPVKGEEELSVEDFGSRSG